MTTPPQDPQSSQRTGWFGRYGPLIAAGFVTGILFSLFQAPDKSTADWMLIAAGTVAAVLLWSIGIRRYSRPKE